MAEGEMEQQTLEAPTQPEAAPAAPDASAQPAAAGKTYTDAQVAEIVSKRVNEINGKWAKYGKPEELDSRLTRAEQIEQWATQMRSQFAPGAQPDGQKLPGQTMQPALTEEDKKVQAYMERLYPGITKYQERMQAFEQQAGQLNDFRWQSISNNNRKSLSEVAEKAGYKPEQILQSDPNTPCIEKYVADSIRGNVKDYQEYMKTGNPAIVQKHFEAVDKWIKGFAPQPPAAPAPNAAAAKDGARIKGLPPRMPVGGVQAPTSGKRKMSDKERVDAAFAAYTKQA